MAGAEILGLERIVCGYGDISVLNELTLSIREGEAVALLGANGAGKTTTVRTISGVLKPRSGTLRLFGEIVRNAAPHRMARLGVAHVPEGRALFPGLTVKENLVTGSFGSRRGASGVSAGLDRVVAIFPWIEARLGQMAGTLSGGQQQMVAIGRGLMSDPRVLILDEPSLGLAPKVVGEVFSVLAAIRTQNVTVVLIEQNANQALNFVTRGYVLNRGTIVFEGSAQSLRDDYFQTHGAYLT